LVAQCYLCRAQGNFRTGLWRQTVAIQPAINQSINGSIKSSPTMERCKDNGAVGWERAETRRNLIKPWTGLPCSLKSGKVDGR